MTDIVARLLEDFALSFGGRVFLEAATKREAAAEIERLRAALAEREAECADRIRAEWTWQDKLTKAHELLAECADDLEYFIDADYPYRDQYPSQLLKLERDMDIVRRARAALPDVPATSTQPA